MPSRQHTLSPDLYLCRSSLCCCWVTSAVSDSVWPYKLQPTRLLCPWDSLGKGTRVGCHALLQGILPTQGMNPSLLHSRQILYHWATREAPGQVSAAAAAKSLRSCLTLCDPIDGSPLGSSVPEILQARTLEWVAISFSNVWKWKGKVKLLSCILLFATPWTAAYQAPPSMGFSRQEYWSGVPLSSPGQVSRSIQILCYLSDGIRQEGSAVWARCLIQADHVHLGPCFSLILLLYLVFSGFLGEPRDFTCRVALGQNNLTLLPDLGSRRMA